MEPTRNELIEQITTLTLINSELEEKITNLEATLARIKPYEKDSYDYETEIAELRTTIRVLAGMVR